MSNDIKNLIKRVGGLRVVDYIGNKYVYNRNIMTGGVPPFVEEEQERLNKLVQKEGVAKMYEGAFVDLFKRLANKGIKVSEEDQIYDLLGEAKALEQNINNALKVQIEGKNNMIALKKIYDLDPRPKDENLDKDYKENYERISRYRDAKFDLKGKSPDELYDEMLNLLHQGYLELYDYDSYPPFISEDDVQTGKIKRINSNGKYVSSEYDQYMRTYAKTNPDPTKNYIDLADS